MDKFKNSMEAKTNLSIDPSLNLDELSIEFIRSSACSDFINENLTFVWLKRTKTISMQSR